MIFSDYHMHSNFSSDSDTPIEQMIQKSIDLGLKEICFTDHMDYDYPKINARIKDGKEIYLDFLFDPESYWRTLSQLQEKYSSQIQIRIGIELGLKEPIQDKVKALMEQYDFDFAIGSSHLLYNDDPYFPSFWDKLRARARIAEPNLNEPDLSQQIVKTAIRDYFMSIDHNIDLFPWFQVYGHLDYIVRYAPGKDTYYQVSDYTDILDSILTKLIAHGQGIELNTSGLKNGLAHANPHTQILKRYRELGGEILTIGSDAHIPEHITYEFNRAQEFLEASGFRYYTTFSKKKPIFHSL